MTTDRWPHTAALLAGGASRRMGTPKARLALPGGRSMAERIVDTLSKVARAVVVAGDEQVAPALPHVADRRPGDGPLAGLEALLASGRDTVYLVCPCDVPLTRPEMFALLVRHAATRASVFTCAGRVCPLPMRLDVSALPVIQRRLDAGERRVGDLLEELAAEIVPAPAAWAPALTSVNRPRDYEAVVTRLSTEA